MDSLKKYATSAKVGTPQMTRTPGRTDEVKNHAGGFVFEVNDKARLERFLILGSEGTYYASAQKITSANISFLNALIAKDEALVLKTLVDVSVQGKAYRNTPAIFTLAMLMVHGKNKAATRAAINSVVRTAPHLYEFVNFLDSFGGWGRAKRGAVSDWFAGKDAESLAFQFIKYRGGRDGWTMRDVMRVAHPQGVDTGVGNFILRGEVGDVPAVITDFEEIKRAGSVAEVLSVLERNPSLPWETIPTQFLNERKVWERLFYGGAVNGQALVRNITRLAKIGMFDDLYFAADYAKALTDVKMIERTRLHPINFLNAAVVYREGQKDRNGSYGYYASARSKSWATQGIISDALDEGFHLAFKTVKPAGKRTMLAIDVSGSMGCDAMGLDLSCAQVSGAMAMTVARTEPASMIRGFTTGNGRGWGRAAELTDLDITARSSLATAMRNVQKNNFGGTDCAQPMLWALENKVEIDTFVVITDNETWAGQVKPVDALKRYRQATGIDARVAVLGVASTGFTIADPRDSGMMDFVGFSSDAPSVLADFSAGRI